MSAEDWKNLLSKFIANKLLIDRIAKYESPIDRVATIPESATYRSGAQTVPEHKMGTNKDFV